MKKAVFIVCWLSTLVLAFMLAHPAGQLRNMKGEYEASGVMRHTHAFLEENGRWPRSWEELGISSSLGEHVHMDFELDEGEAIRNPSVFYASIQPRVYPGIYLTYPDARKQMDALFNELRALHAYDDVIRAIDTLKGDQASREKLERDLLLAGFENTFAEGRYLYEEYTYERKPHSVTLTVVPSSPKALQVRVWNWDTKTDFTVFADADYVRRVYPNYLEDEDSQSTSFFAGPEHPTSFDGSKDKSYFRQVLRVTGE